MRKVFVGSLSWNTSEESLSNLFSKIGEIEELKIITDRETGRSRGFGFVTFSSEEDANTAVRELDGTELDGRQLKINIAKERDRDSGGGGGGGHSAPRSFSGSRNRW